jgi:ABC-type Fe3+ transport system permease subunit
MANTDKIAPIAAALTALTTLVCCMPMGFAAAAATIGLSTIAAEYQSWFLAASGVLLAVGFVQVRRSRKMCVARGSSSIVVYCISAAIVALVVFFPQTLAGVMADWLP